MSEFVAIDVETANASLASICQVGVATFEDGALTETWSSLIDPEMFFDEFNVEIHGIDAETVDGAPTFPQISDSLNEMLSDRTVVSHMPFDRGALRQTCSRYGLPIVECTWLDSARVARRTWPDQFRQRGYGLANVADWCGVEFRHHDALEDARAAGEILLRAVQESGLTVPEWVKRSTQPIGGPGGTTPSVKREGNPDGPLASEVVCFTGTLSIPRREAADMAAAAGCDVTVTVTKKLTMLVLGDQDDWKLGGYEKSSKQRKAEAQARAGRPVRIVGEADFVALCG